jgi:hypothetical protein
VTVVPNRSRLNKRFKIILLVLVLALAGYAIATVIHKNRQPVYQGRNVDQWLEEVFTTNQSAAFQAFRAMGTNALPGLAQNLERKYTILDKFYAWGFAHLPLKWARPAWKPFRIQERWNAADLILLNLPNIRPILPRLMQIVADTNSYAREYTFTPVSGALRPADTNYLPIFEKLLLETNLLARRAAPGLLTRLKTNATPAIPSLIHALDDSDFKVQFYAASALWNIAHLTNGAPVFRRGLNTTSSTPGVNLQVSSAGYLHYIDKDDLSLIPIFTNAVSGPSPWAEMAVQALGDYGPAAKSAAPLIENVITAHRDSGEVHLALQALKKIDPDAAAKYEKNDEHSAH